mmetsp:Transcript_3197/g.9168  ORF Transcript_3197/g.9168 Transcript_3197/m.9168 type:complete len:238 (+) Transcript_3197:5857-6570(+)
MSDISLRDKCSTTTGRPHRRHKLNIYELHVGVLLAVVPARVVHPLPQDFNGRLGAVFLLRRHIEIIDKHDTFLAEGWPQHALPPLIELAINNILGLVRRRLGREVEHNIGKLLVVSGHQRVVLDTHTLPGARVAHTQHVRATIQELFDEPLVADRIYGRDHDAIELRLFGDDELGPRFHPGRPAPGLAVKSKVVDARRRVRRELRLALLQTAVLVVRGLGLEVLVLVGVVDLRRVSG